MEAKVIPLLVFLLDSGGNIRIIGPAAFLGLGGGLWNVITAGCAAFDRNVKILLPIRFNGFSIDLIVVILVHLYIHIQYIYVCVFVYINLYTQKCPQGLCGSRNGNENVDLFTISDCVMERQRVFAGKNKKFGLTMHPPRGKQQCNLQSRM